MSTNYEYRSSIANYCNRVFRENMIDIVETINISGKKEFAINFISKPWFNELDKEMQDNIINNCTDHIKDNLQKILEEHKDSQTSDNKNFKYSIK